MSDVLEWIANNVFGQVPILIGLIVLLGLLLQRKPFEDVVSGALRAAIGIVILFIGVDTFVAGLASFQAILSSAVNLDPPAAETTLADFLASEGGTVAMIITVGFFLHLLLVRLFTAARFVYLTGHLMFWISVIVAASFVEAFGDVNQTTLVLCGSIVVASYWTLQPLWIEPLMKRVTGRDEFGYGHTSSLACLATGFLSKPMGRHHAADTEKLKIPRQLAFFKDVNVSTALIIGAILLIAMAFADQDVVKEQAVAFNEDIATWTWGIVAALRFAAGIAILLFGVRMFLGEIIPAFKGFSDKLVPDTRPALDVPTIFPFAPTAVMVGFVTGTAFFLVMMGVFAAFGWFTLVPPMIMLFFVCGGAAVFGNAVAGWRGAVVGGLISSLWLAIGQAVLWGMLDNTAPELATLGDPDWYAVSWLLLALAEPFGGSGGIWVVAAIVGVITVIVLGLLSLRGVRVGADEPARPAEATS